MNTTTILKTYHSNNYVTDDVINAIQNDNELRKNLVDYLRHHKDCQFAIALLDRFVVMLKDKHDVKSEDLYLACYILALGGNIEDCLKIWHVKTWDFDFFCGLDIELVAFSGLQETIDFLQIKATSDAQAAKEYILRCGETGDLDNLEKYFSPENLPWWI